MGRLAALILTAVLAFGCAGQPAGVNDSIGAANVLLTGLAKATLTACGNTEPGGDCLPSAPIDRADVDNIKIRLVEAGRLLDVAAIGGDSTTSALDALQVAQQVLGEVRAILHEKGVSK